MGSEQGINVGVSPAPVLVMKTEDLLPGRLCSQEEQPATEERPAARENAVHHNAERKPAEDPTAIIESLRARLLSERNASRSAKQQAQQLARKVKELEGSLHSEVQTRSRCERRIQQLLSKLETAGIEVPEDEGEDKEDEKSEEEEQGKQLKPNWIRNNVTRSRRHSLEANLADLRSRSSNNFELDHENLSIGSPSSDPGSSSAQRRVGRSCRTIRRRETRELGIDEQVKGAWRKVGQDIIELAKLRNGDVGETSSDMFESNQDSSENSEDTSEPQEKQTESEVQSCTTDPQQNGSTEQVSVSVNEPQEAAAGSIEAQISAPETSIENSEVQSPSKTADTKTNEAEPSTERTEGTLTTQSLKDTATVSTSQQFVEPRTRPDDDVEEVLKALKLAKQQLKQAHFQQQQGYSNTAGYYSAPTPSLFSSRAPFLGPVFPPSAYSFFPQQSGPSMPQHGYVSTARFASAEEEVYHSHHGGPRLYYVDKLNVAGDLRYYAP